MGSWRGELRAQFRLALPVVVIQVGMMAMGFVDCMFLGRVSATHLAATSLGHAWSFTWLGMGFGTLIALDPVASQAWGARDREALARGLQRGLFLALVLSAPLSVPVVLALPVFQALGLDPSVYPIAADYSVVSAAGIPAFLAFVVLRTVLQAMHLLRPIVLTILATNLLNAGLDWVLVFGNLGFPALGAVGSSWATVLSRWSMASVLVFLAWPELRRYLVPWRPTTLQLRPLLRILGIGWPIGMQFVIEMGTFSLVTFLMGVDASRWGALPGLDGAGLGSLGFGADAVGGHTIALQLASLSFMVPLGISIAASVRVGNEIGRGDPAAVRLAAKVALCCGAGVMLVFASLFLAFPGPLARIFTDEPGVLEVAVLLLPLAACFQVFDGTQVVAGGCLRGAADTRVPLLAQILGFWTVGLPLGAWLAFWRGMGPEGLWWGLAAALAMVALVLLARVRVRLSRSLERVRVDDDEHAGGAAAELEGERP